MAVFRIWMNTVGNGKLIFFICRWALYKHNILRALIYVNNCRKWINMARALEHDKLVDSIVDTLENNFVQSHSMDAQIKRLLFRWFFFGDFPLQIRLMIQLKVDWHWVMHNRWNMTDIQWDSEVKRCYSYVLTHVNSTAQGDKQKCMQPCT